jgi:prolyl-tRNA editing enzyme YbaK/EbsC (Cys-tRNA(Pro) deacylase)
LPVYLDISLRDFDQVLPAAGAVHSAVRLTPETLCEIVKGEWVDVCQAPQGPADS